MMLYVFLYRSTKGFLPNEHLYKIDRSDTVLNATPGITNTLTKILVEPD